MSASLRWSIPEEGRSIDAEGEFALREALSAHYGDTGPWSLGMADIQFLSGVAATGVAAAAELIRVIETNGGIKVWISYA